MYQNKKRVRIQKMVKKYRKFQYNLAIDPIVYTLFYKNKKNFFIFFKPWYNWYKLKKLVIPMLIRSFLYLHHLVQSGTIGTIVKKASNTNEIGGRAHDFLYIFITYTKRGIQRP